MLKTHGMQALIKSLLFSSASWEDTCKGNSQIFDSRKHAVWKSVKEWRMRTLLCHFLKVFLCLYITFKIIRFLVSDHCLIFQKGTLYIQTYIFPT